MAVVTGTAMGIGAPVARLIAEGGSQVVALDWKDRALASPAVASDLPSCPLSATLVERSTHEGGANAAGSLGRLRYWVNSAGIDIVGGAHEVAAEQIHERCASYWKARPRAASAATPFCRASSRR
ncbi:MAG: SDR family NAD(P)-dependent oxidoreductase [Acidimicrobiales bacterium]